MLEKQLQASLKEKDYFKVRQLLNKKDGISPDKRTYYSAFVASAFNQPSVSIAQTNQLLAANSSFVDDSMRVDLLLLLRDNYFKTFQYQKAAFIGKELLNKYQHQLGLQRDAVQNTLLIHQALAAIPAQQVSIRPDSIRWKRNQIGLLEIPIQINHTPRKIIVDTRAHLSTVTQSFAKQIGLRILPVTYQESSGITGKSFTTGLGIADSLYIGHILFRHVVFQVVPDEILYFPPIRYQMQGILGFPVITALNQVRFISDGRLILGRQSSKKPLHNLAFDGSTTVVWLKSDEDTLSFHFDTGATGTEFYSNYFNKYKTRVLQRSVLQRIESGGAGGVVEREVYILPTVNLYIGSKKAVLKAIAVHKTPTYKGQAYFGNIGQDVINQFQEMTLNFKDMSLSFQ
ncbi:aspartyl protease family protein [Spirosoma gilvum]